IEEVSDWTGNLGERLKISSAARIILPYHQLLDEVKEEQRGEDGIGTTGRGRGPAYGSKVTRGGIRMGGLAHPRLRREQFSSNIADINETLQHIYKRDPIEPEPIINDLLEAAEVLSPYVANTAHILHEAVENGEEVLLEGAQGSLLDVDHGTYPYVTSSCPTSGGACTGSGIPPTAVDNVMGITKAFCTRVCYGPFTLVIRLIEAVR